MGHRRGLARQERRHTHQYARDASDRRFLFRRLARGQARQELQGHRCEGRRLLANLFPARPIRLLYQGEERRREPAGRGAEQVKYHCRETTWPSWIERSAASTI